MVSHNLLNRQKSTGDATKIHSFKARTWIRDVFTVPQLSLGGENLAYIKEGALFILNRKTSQEENIFQ